jgi:SAM-dependent methyltransferase
MGSAYDAFAWFYNQYWAAQHHEWQKTALDRLLYPCLRGDARIMDLCCGTGQLARDLVSRGYHVTGLDSSEEMLRYARQNAPGARFLCADATNFRLEHRVNAAVCGFDSINHILQPADVAAVFRNAFDSIEPGGVFLLDVNTPSAYGEQWNGKAAEVGPDRAFFLRGRFDPVAGIGITQITMFRLHDIWQRSDVEIRQRPWEIAELETMLETAKFIRITAHRAIEDLGMCGHFGPGRVYIRACRPPD